MSETENHNQDTPLPKPPKPWVTLLMGGILVFSGMVIGGGVTAIVVKDRVSTYDDRSNKPIPPRVVNYITRELDLSPDQSDSVKTILHDHNERFRIIRGDTAEQIQEAMSTMRSEIQAVLTPEQAGKWEKMFQKVRRRAMPDYPHRYDGERPPPRDHPRWDGERRRHGDDDERRRPPRRHGEDDEIGFQRPLIEDGEVEFTPPPRVNDEFGERPPPPNDDRLERRPPPRDGEQFEHRRPPPPGGNGEHRRPPPRPPQ